LQDDESVLRWELAWLDPPEHGCEAVASRSPAISASIISRQETPGVVQATEASLIPGVFEQLRQCTVT
jgi:hypothetical protein